MSNVKISMADISDLRERSGAGVAACKNALIESEGDKDTALELLRQKGLASAAKKQGKVAADGAVLAKTSEDGQVGLLLELNCQTDFVAKNEKFQALLAELAGVALQNKAASIEALKACKVSSGESVEEYLSLQTAQIGEKLDLRRLELFVADASKHEHLFSYTHPIGSKIAVLGVVSSQAPSAEVATFSKDIAMHIAAYQPQAEFLQREDIPADVIENEKRIELGKADLANKPEEIREKIVTGRVEKVLLDKVLLEQAYIKDSSKKIKDFVAEHKAQILKFKRFNLGEGIEKVESNFADEVAAQMAQH